MNMNVFCPDCKAEYQVSERSSPNLTIKFVCYQCKSSWIDKIGEDHYEKNEAVADDNNSGKNDLLKDDMNNQSQLLSSLALAEIDNSFGKQKSDETTILTTEKSNLPFNFETSESSEILIESGPTQSFPDLKRQSNSPKEINNTSDEERNNKEIEIERRLKESTELLKKARENSELDAPISKERIKNNRLILYISGILVILIFSVNLAFIFGDIIITNFPVTEGIITELFYYSDITIQFFKKTYITISQFIVTNLV